MDWNIFKFNNANIHDYTDRVTSYISVCEENCIPSNTFLSHSNDKPWFIGELRARRSTKEEDNRSKTRVLYREAKKKLLSGIKAADCSSVWKGLKQITNYKPKAPPTEEDSSLLNKLNQFYCRFDTQAPPFPIPLQAPLSSTLLPFPGTPHPSPSLSQADLPPPLVITEQEVNRLFRKQNSRNAADPDKVSPATRNT
ncbi:hypothetical protein J4Q44_G00158170 [Coregonus suidteri]|uniref:Uncharacterized protein n=1 Tax=Coregonus suidteri TaxID=861788 RepID=A0AAN8QXL8_9TELE